MTLIRPTKLSLHLIRISSHREVRGLATTSTTQLRSIRPTNSERSTKQLTPQHIQFALEALHEDGIVLIEQAIQNLDEIAKVDASICRFNQIDARSSVERCDGERCKVPSKSG